VAGAVPPRRRASSVAGPAMVVIRHNDHDSYMCRAATRTSGQGAANWMSTPPSQEALPGSSCQPLVEAGPAGDDQLNGPVRVGSDELPAGSVGVPHVVNDALDRCWDLRLPPAALESLRHPPPGWPVAEHFDGFRVAMDRSY